MFSIISDGGCDFCKLEATKHHVGIVPFYINIDEHTSVREGIDLSKEEFFHRLKTEKDLKPKTAQPSPQDFLDKIVPELEQGKDVLVLTISSKLSGSFQSATIAADMVRDDFPNATVAIVDSLNASIGQGLILREIIAMRDANFSLADTLTVADEVISNTHTYVTLDTLEFVKRGGRVSSMAAFVGNALGLRPILQIKDGVVITLDKARGKKKAIGLLRENIANTLVNVKNNVNLSIGQIANEADSLSLRDAIESALDVVINLPITEIGAAIGTHAGPGAFGFSHCPKFYTLLSAKLVTEQMQTA